MPHMCDGDEDSGDSWLPWIGPKDKTELKQNSNQLKPKGICVIHVPGNSGLSRSKDLSDIVSSLALYLIVLIFPSVTLEKK